MCVTEPDFFSKKSPFRIFGLFRKIYSLVLSGNGVEWKYLWPFSILQKLHTWENLVVKLCPKILLASHISVFFNGQYLFNGLTSDSDFTRQGLLMGFLKKLSFRANGPFWAQKWQVLITLALHFFEILHYERGQGVQGNYIIRFIIRLSLSLYGQGKIQGESVFFNWVRQNQGIYNVVRENHSTILTSVREKRVYTQELVSIDQCKLTQMVLYPIQHLFIKYFCSYYVVCPEFVLYFYYK